jgi:hypothetical protein
LKIVPLIAIICSSFSSYSQTIGGSSAFNFLHLPPDPILTALGGVNVSYSNHEVGLAANNPSLLDPSLNKKINASFNDLPGGIKAYSLTGALYDEKYHTNFGGHIYFVDYGTIPQTDAAGNQFGYFHPVDYVVQVSASRSYLEKWRYGLSFKLIGSNYQSYKSFAVAIDFGLHYMDSIHLFSAGLVAKNMGLQVKSFGGVTEDLPFDLQIGITKKLAHAPLAFSLTAQKIHQLNIGYYDPAIVSGNGGSSLFYKIFNHFVIGSHIFISSNLELNLGYNYLKRNELTLGTSTNGLTGFSGGIRVIFQKLEILYSRSAYQKNISYNQFGIEIPLQEFFSQL